VAQLTSGEAFLDFAAAFTALDVMNGRSKTRKKTQPNATDNGVMIKSEMVRM
jgi:hypothetical protein